VHPDDEEASSGPPSWPGGAWLDACAGAGGKALQLAAMLGERGRVAAEDVRPAALAQLRLRAARARLSGRVSADRVGGARPPTGGFDGALVDAPCSGSGTWRRAPHLRWQMDATRLAALCELQLRILSGAAARVRPGGTLLYATCSLAPVENGDVVDAFLASAAGRDYEPAGLPAAEALGLGPAAGGRLTLQHQVHDTDGFFIAAMRRRTAA
jgi:16S rRNA (cytosine967-C5)-methyltransferase